MPYVPSLFFHLIAFLADWMVAHSSYLSLGWILGFSECLSFKDVFPYLREWKKRIFPYARLLGLYSGTEGIVRVETEGKEIRMPVQFLTL